MDSTKKLELDRVLDQVDDARAWERQQERDRQIQERRYVRQFQALAGEMLKPTIRRVMRRLQEGGHMTRLRDVSPNLLRFDVLLEAHRQVAGLVEIELVPDSNGTIRIACLRNLSPVVEKDFHIDEVDEDAVTDLLITFMRSLLGSVPRRQLK